MQQLLQRGSAAPRAPCSSEVRVSCKIQRSKLSCNSIARLQLPQLRRQHRYQHAVCSASAKQHRGTELHTSTSRGAATSSTAKDTLQIEQYEATKGVVVVMVRYVGD